MHTPSWWDKENGLVRLLSPLSRLYRVGYWLHHAVVRPRVSRIPVICVGNVVAGGAGKTPLTQALAILLKSEGYAPHIISRGYKGALQGPVRVNPTRHGAADVGDEPLLLARSAPVWVSRDRPAGISAAAEAGATLALLDDGLQNPRLAPDLSLLVIDGGYGIGNGCLLPAGPLRQPFRKALKAADAVVMIGDDRHHLKQRVPDAMPVFQAVLMPDKEVATRLSGQRVVAFAGIGRPAKFADTLRGLGAELVSLHPFPDHTTYTPTIITRLRAEAERSQARLVTTEKDWVKLSESERECIMPVPVMLTFANEVEVRRWLCERLGLLMRGEGS